MKKFMIPVIAIGLLLSACAGNYDKAQRVLEDSGYTDVHVGSWAWFGCGKDDSFSNIFTAKGPNGREVSGVVCSGWFKGSTIRLD